MSKSSGVLAGTIFLITTLAVVLSEQLQQQTLFSLFATASAQANSAASNIDSRRTCSVEQLWSRCSHRNPGEHLVNANLTLGYTSPTYLCGESPNIWV